MQKGRNLRIKGDLSAAEDLTVDFAIDGSVDLPANRLVVTEDAQLNATVTAASVTVHGHLDGHISAERLEITSSAVVNAGVVATRLALHDGAHFTGPVNTERAKAAAIVARHRQKTPLPSRTA
jgi:cytoskeletal protein CcmA (bactofilin family)